MTTPLDDITRELTARASAPEDDARAMPRELKTFPLLDGYRGRPHCDIEALIAERTHAKKTRNFHRADAIRNELLEKGILLEDSKDGVRWKRK